MSMPSGLFHTHVRDRRAHKTADDCVTMSFIPASRNVSLTLAVQLDQVWDQSVYCGWVDGETFIPPCKLHMESLMMGLDDLHGRLEWDTWG